MYSQYITLHYSTLQYIAVHYSTLPLLYEIFCASYLKKILKMLYLNFFRKFIINFTPVNFNAF